MTYSPDSDPNRADDSNIDPHETLPTPSPELFDDPVATEDSPRRIDLYTLIELLGSGGMGEVWLAQQSRPVKRRVAVKLIRSGLGSGEVLRRFEAERQALALMNHPNIAQILDAGTTSDGQPYFVMELVTGLPLTDYCDREHLSIEDRLQLFIDVCSGVQHAHQKGIIHRDLKPSNILVSESDGAVVPKIIDFGLAKAMESTQRLTDQSLYTGIGQILGTLKYMSPEQANLESEDIDTRADIYALGVILYELLTGSTPLDDVSIKGQAVMKVLDFIRDQEPVKPSSRLFNSSSAEVSTVTGQRKTDSVRLRRILAGDLDWIVMKALEKDRVRRYESASGFAADIHRYLNSEPVVARPPSVNYRIQKFVRKNRMAVVATTVLLAAIIGGMVGTGWGWIEARRQAAEAETQRQEAVNHLALARESVSALGDAFEKLDPRGQYQTVADLRNGLLLGIEQSLDRLNEIKLQAPLEGANLENTLGLSLFRLGESEKAIELLSNAWNTRKELLGLDDEATLESQNNLAGVFRSVGKVKQALPLYIATFDSLSRKLGADDPKTLTAKHNLASGYRFNGQLEEAIKRWQEVLEGRKKILKPGDPDTLMTINNLAAGLMEAGEHQEGLKMFLEAVKENETVHPPFHPDLLSAKGNLATAYLYVKQPEKAIPIYLETLGSRKSVLPSTHPDIAINKNNLAYAYKQDGQVDLAIPLFVEALADMNQISGWGSDQPERLIAMLNLADCYQQQGQSGDAFPLYNEATEQIIEHRDSIARTLSDRLPAALENLIKISEQLGKQESLKKYRDLQRELAPSSKQRE